MYEGWKFPLYILRGHSSKFLNDVLKSLEIVLTSAKSVDPDEILHYAAYYLGLHCLQKYPFMGFQNTMRSAVAQW